MILSTDFGAIAYYAKDHKFIDKNGFLSQDVFNTIKTGGSMPEVIKNKQPQYIADTFNINSDGKYVYNQKGLDAVMYAAEILAVKRVSNKLGIGIAKIKYK